MFRKTARITAHQSLKKPVCTRRLKIPDAARLQDSQVLKMKTL